MVTKKKKTKVDDGLDREVKGEKTEQKIVVKKKAKKKASKPRELKLPEGNGLHRKNVRYRLFRIRDDNDVNNDDLKEHIENQFQFGMTWKTFTFTWDVAPRDPLTVITEDMWDETGGGYDLSSGALYPTAFTRQP